MVGEEETISNAIELRDRIKLAVLYRKVKKIYLVKKENYLN